MDLNKSMFLYSSSSSFLIKKSNLDHNIGIYKLINGT